MDRELRASGEVVESRHLIDPTHVRGFHPLNFDYFIRGRELHRKYGHYYFDFAFAAGAVTRPPASPGSSSSPAGSSSCRRPRGCRLGARSR